MSRRTTVVRAVACLVLACTIPGTQAISFGKLAKASGKHGRVVGGSADSALQRSATGGKSAKAPKRHHKTEGGDSSANFKITGTFSVALRYPRPLPSVRLVFPFFFALSLCRAVARFGEEFLKTCACPFSMSGLMRPGTRGCATGITSRCTFAMGDGTGDDEIMIGTVNSKEGCEMLVLQNDAIANGATWGETTLECYAEYGMTGTCLDGSIYQTGSVFSQDGRPGAVSFPASMRADAPQGSERITMPACSTVFRRAPRCTCPT